MSTRELTPGSPPPSAASWLIRAIGAYARADHLTARLRLAIYAATEALLCQALTDAEKSATTAHLYDVVGKGTVHDQTLFDWELTWYRERLPPAPADILLGGAGSGREARWLRDQGYRVFAFEPVARCLPALRAVIGPDGAAYEGSYDELCTAALSGEPSPLSSLCARSYAAVILGWGSFSHVLGQAAQQRLLQAADTLTPDGPVLASFFLQQRHDASRRSRAAALGQRVGTLIAEARGMRPVPQQEMMLPHSGFLHLFSEPELLQLAASVGRSLRLERDWYARGTFERAVVITP